MKKNVPISATGMAMAGMSVERRSCRKMYTTINTSMNASIRVFITSSIEAYKKSLAFCAIFICMPSGKPFSASASTLLISSIISVAFVPAIWNAIQETPVFPLTLLVKSYVSRPNSTRAISLSLRTCPSCVARITMFSNSVSVCRRPR